MNINEKQIKLWSAIGPRAAFGLSALDFAKEFDDLMILTCDVSTSAGLDRFKNQFKDKYLDLGIAEQNLIGVASGLASENYRVVTTTFAPFQTMRCNEQIKVNLGYMKKNICMVGIASGLVLGTLGYTHCCIEDIGAIRSIPGLTIVSPADSLETVKSIREIIKNKIPAYVRLTGSSNNPIVYEKDYEFKIGKSILLKDGEQVVIYCNGASVYRCIEASKMLEEKKINTKVVNMHTVKPLDEEEVKNSCKKAELIVTVEEHNIIGGLGSAVSETISKLKNSPRHLSLGVKDAYGKCGNYKFMLEKHRLTPEKIVEDILYSLKN